MERKIKVNGKEYQIRELLNKEMQEYAVVDETMTQEKKAEIVKENIKKETMACASITSEQYDALTYKEYLTLRKAIIELNTPESDFWVTN
jgi:hypothetical protein